MANRDDYNELMRIDSERKAALDLKRSKLEAKNADIQTFALEDFPVVEPLTEEEQLEREESGKSLGFSDFLTGLVRDPVKQIPRGVYSDSGLRADVHSGLASAPLVRWYQDFKNTTDLPDFVENSDILRSAKERLGFRDIQPDPSFDGLRQATDVREQVGAENVRRLADARSQEEFDWIYSDLLKQHSQAALSSSTALGTFSAMGASLLSWEEALFTIGTGGSALLGVTANSLRKGVTANTIRGATLGGTGAAIGSSIDANTSIEVSSEDVALAALLGTTFGAAVGGTAGKVFKPAPVQPRGTTLHSFGGAFGKGITDMYNAAVRKNQEEYVRKAADDISKEEELRDDIVNKRSELRRADIEDMDFDGINHDDWDASVDRWFDDNQIELREQIEKGKAEKVVESLTGTRTLSETFRQSKSKTAQIIGYHLEKGTGSVQKNRTMDMGLHILQTRLIGTANADLDAAMSAYARRKYGQGGLMSRLLNDFRARREFNEELTMMSHSMYNNGGTLPKSELDKYSKEVRDVRDSLDDVMRAIRQEADTADVTGFKEITDRRGFLPVKHERRAIIKAEAEYGTEKVVNLYRKSMMSKMGAGITDYDKATRIARAFVDRFSGTPTDLRSGSVMEDDAWEIMQRLFEEEGLDFDGKSLKEAFQGEVRTKQADSKRVKYAQKRLPLDITVSDGSLRMIDLINTDVQNLTSSYAMSMGGQISLAKFGIKNRATQEKLTKRMIKEDPALAARPEIQYDPIGDLWSTFNTGRTAGGVSNRWVALTVKATVLARLNNLGLGAQAAETGGIAAYWGTKQFMRASTRAASDMFTGKRTPEAKALANDTFHGMYSVGIDHEKYPPHLNAEMQSNSQFSQRELIDYADTLVGLGLRAQGWTSAFNPVRQYQQRMATDLLINNIARTIESGAKFDEKLAVLGMSEDLFDSIKRNMVKHANGRTNPDGTFDMSSIDLSKERPDIGFDKWDSKTQEDFLFVVARNEGSLVQRAMAGETIPFMSKEYGALLFQFKKFTVEALRKQVLRNGNLGRQHFATVAALNTLSAGMALTAVNYLKGRDSQTDFEGALRAGIQYNATLGTIGSIWDIGISVSGLPEAMMVNPYGKMFDMVQIPALGVANDWIGLPAGITDSLDGELDDYDSRRAFKSVPIIGNHAVVMGLLNAMGDDE